MQTKHVKWLQAVIAATGALALALIYVLFHVGDQGNARTDESLNAGHTTERRLRPVLPDPQQLLQGIDWYGGERVESAASPSSPPLEANPDANAILARAAAHAERGEVVDEAVLYLELLD